MIDALTNAFAAYAALGFLGMAAIGGCALAALIFSFREDGWLAFASLAALGAALFHFLGVHPLAWPIAHPVAAGLAAAGYFLAGSLWSVFKFRLYTGDLKTEFRDFKARWMSGNGYSDFSSIPEDILKGFRELAEGHMTRAARYRKYPVAPADHKAEILFWMGWWPVSAVAWILDEPIRRLLDLCYRLFSGVYAKIAAEQSAEYMEAMGKTGASGRKP